MTLCTKCALHKYALPGQRPLEEGSPHAKCLVFGGTAKLADTATRRPFVGRAGGLLRKCLLEAFRRDEFYLAYTTICPYPVAEASPPLLWVEKCAPYVEALIKQLNPLVIIALGLDAAAALLLKYPEHQGQSLGELRKEFHPREISLAGVSTNLLVTYHPGYCARVSGIARLMRADIEKAKELVHGKFYAATSDSSGTGIRP